MADDSVVLEDFETFKENFNQALREDNLEVCNSIEIIYLIKIGLYPVSCDIYVLYLLRFINFVVTNVG